MALGFELTECSVPSLADRVTHLLDVVFGGHADGSRPVPPVNEARIQSASVGGKVVQPQRGGLKDNSDRRACSVTESRAFYGTNPSPRAQVDAGGIIGIWSVQDG